MAIDFGKRCGTRREDTGLTLSTRMHADRQRPARELARERRFRSRVRGRGMGCIGFFTICAEELVCAGILRLVVPCARNENVVLAACWAP